MPKIIESCTEINSKSMQNSRQRRRCFLEALGVNFCRKKVLGGRGFEWLWRPSSATNRKKGHPMMPKPPKSVKKGTEINTKSMKNRGCVEDVFWVRFLKRFGLKVGANLDPLWRQFSVKNWKKGIRKGIQKLMLKRYRKSMPKGCQNEAELHLK